MKINISVSVGEIVDKISILKIKLVYIYNHTKEINEEIDLLQNSISYLNIPRIYFDQFYCINKELWDVEDALRDKEKNKIFDKEFIKLARSVYILNDKRFALKKKINEEYNSEIKEFKSYTDYV